MAPVPRPRLARAALALALGACACQATPSFRLRWQLTDREGETPREITAATQCSNVGMNTVRILVTDPLGLVAHEDFFPCFARGFADEDTMIAGPELDPGEYVVEVRGLQRDLLPWTAGELDEDSTQFCSGAAETIDCNPLDVACDCHGLDARKDATITIDPFVLVPPRECIDGIDNDHDGLTDAQDSACSVGGDVPESLEVSAVQFRATVTLLDGNPRARCDGVGIGELHARACPAAAVGEQGCADADAIEIGASECRTDDAVFFDATLPVGDYVLELTGRAGDTARTRPQLFPFTLLPGAGAFVPIEVDFAASSFDPPIEALASFGLGFASDADGGEIRGCVPGTDDGVLAIDEVTLEVRDAHGGPVSPAVGFTGRYGAPQPATGACTTAEIHTDPLTWGGWTLRVVARAADGTVCFTTDGAGTNGADAPLQLAPGADASSLVIPRVFADDGLPPPSCRDCSGDGDCGNHVCQDGVCVAAP